MLDLEPRVHLEKVEALVLADHELDGAGGIVADRLGEPHRLLAHRLAGLGIEQRARRFLDDFLIAALDRTFALAEMDHLPVPVTEHLDFDVARVDDEFFDEHPVVAERGFRLRSGAREPLRDLGAGAGDAHALAAAAGRGLDHDRVADLGGDPHRVLVVLDGAEEARHGRHLGDRSGLLGRDLVAHGGDGLRVRTDENDAGGGKRRRERLAFGQEAVTWMHRFGAARPARGHDLLDREIALGCCRRADGHGRVGHFDVQRILVGVGIDRDRCYAEAPRRLDDPAGDLAAVRDQNAFEHAGFPVRPRWLCGAPL